MCSSKQFFHLVFIHVLWRPESHMIFFNTPDVFASTYTTSRYVSKMLLPASRCRQSSRVRVRVNIGTPAAAVAVAAVAAAAKSLDGKGSKQQQSTTHLFFLLKSKMLVVPKYTFMLKYYLSTNIFP